MMAELTIDDASPFIGDGLNMGASSISTTIATRGSTSSTTPSHPPSPLQGVITRASSIYREADMARNKAHATMMSHARWSTNRSAEAMFDTGMSSESATYEEKLRQLSLMHERELNLLKSNHKSALAQLRYEWSADTNDLKRKYNDLKRRYDDYNADAERGRLQAECDINTKKAVAACQKVSNTVGPRWSLCYKT